MPKHQPGSSRSRIQDRRLVRLDEQWLQLPNPHGVPVEVCANSGVPIEAGAVDEIASVLETAATLDRLAREAPSFLGESDARLSRITLMPDFHKGAGIPIGTALETVGALLPQAVGNDINCGMRLEVTALRVEQLRPHLDSLAAKLRHLFFQGGREIPLSAGQREALLREGLPGLLGALGPSGWSGLWRFLSAEDAERAVTHVHGGGGHPAASARGFGDWIGSAGGVSYDSIIGSVGGGNHFAEVQYVAGVRDPQAAYAWGLRAGMVVLMVHTGSLGLGHQANHDGIDLLRSIWPKGMPHPSNGIFPLPLTDRHAGVRETYMQGLRNAANFALGNRLCLALMLRAGLAEVAGRHEVASRLVYDAPHNLLWPLDGGRVVHRKGATPAGGPAGRWGDPLFGEPVIVPGSMGASSYVLRGLGNARTVSSACHGAGRRIARGALSKGGDAELDAFLREFRVVTPVDPGDPRIAGRADVLAAWRRDLKQEAPWAYKDIGPVVSTLEEAKVATIVAELRPLLTVKA